MNCKTVVSIIIMFAFCLLLPGCSPDKVVLQTTAVSTDRISFVVPKAWERSEIASYKGQEVYYPQNADRFDSSSTTIWDFLYTYEDDPFKKKQRHCLMEIQMIMKYLLKPPLNQVQSQSIRQLKLMEQNLF